MSSGIDPAHMIIQDQVVDDRGNLVLSIKATAGDRSYDLPYKIAKDQIAGTTLEMLMTKVLDDVDERVRNDIHREQMLAFYAGKVGKKIELRKKGA